MAQEQEHLVQQIGFDLVNSAQRSDERAQECVNFRANPKDYTADCPKPIKLCSIPLYVSANSQYSMNITVGTSPKEYNVLLDTASSILWMPALQCDTEARHKDTSNNLASTSRMGYKSSVTICQNSVRIGDLVIQKQLIAAAGSYPGRTKFDGIFGLGRFPTSPGASQSPLWNMIDQRLIDPYVFALYLGGPKSVSSEIVFGGTKKKHFVGTLQKIPLRREDLWEVDLDLIRVGSCAMFPKATGAILDSGTSSITLPSMLADTINKVIGRIRCDQREALPDITFTLAGHNFSLGPYDYTDMVGDNCTSRIVGLDIPSPDGPLAILGSPFLEKWYSVFDLRDSSVSLGEAARSATF